MTDQTENQTVALAIRNVTELHEIVSTLRNPATKGGLVKGVDYGIIPGTGDKDTLLLPGMEKLCRALNAEPEYHYLDEVRDWDNGFFAFEFECTLRDVSTAEVLPGGRGVGSCNSKESSFAWRYMHETELPKSVNHDELESVVTTASEFAFAIDKAETSGKWGKSKDYWDKFSAAIKDGTAIQGERKTKKGAMLTWDIETVMFRVPNMAIYDQVNAILKRAKKRALGDAIKGAANVSEYFTVDLEDNAGSAAGQSDNVVDGKFEDVTDAPPTSAQGVRQKTENQRAFETAIDNAGFDLEVVAALFDFPGEFDQFYDWMVNEKWDWERGMSEIVELAILGGEWFQTRKVTIKSKSKGDPNSASYYEFDLGFGDKQRARVWTRASFRDAGYDVSAWDKIGTVRIDPPIHLHIQRNDKGFLDVVEVRHNDPDYDKDPSEFIDIPDED